MSDRRCETDRDCPRGSAATSVKALDTDSGAEVVIRQLPDQRWQFHPTVYVGSNDTLRLLRRRWPACDSFREGPEHFLKPFGLDFGFGTFHEPGAGLLRDRLEIGQCHGVSTTIDDAVVAVDVQYRDFPGRETGGLSLQAA